MSILIIGGTGRSGKLVIQESLRRGFTVTALVRNPKSLEDIQGLRCVTGSPLNRSDIESAFHATGKDMPTAVIVTLASKRTTDSPFSAPVSPPRLMADAHANLAAAMKKRGIRKIVTMASFGTGDSFAQLHCLIKVLFSRSNMAYSYRDHDLVDKEMRERDYLDWVMVRPCRLAEGEAAPVKEFGDVGKGTGVLSSITRKSVAHFLVDAAEQDVWNGKTPVLSN